MRSDQNSRIEDDGGGVVSGWFGGRWEGLAARGGANGVRSDAYLAGARIRLLGVGREGLASRSVGVDILGRDAAGGWDGGSARGEKSGRARIGAY